MRRGLYKLWAQNLGTTLFCMSVIRRLFATVSADAVVKEANQQQVAAKRFLTPSTLLLTWDTNPACTSLGLLAGRPATPFGDGQVDWSRI